MQAISHPTQAIHPSWYPSSAKSVTTLSEKVYTIYFQAVKNFIDLTTRMHARPFGLVAGTLLLEFAPAMKSTIRRLCYHKEPTHYGFNQFTPEHQGKSPAILLHGRMGKWQDVAALAEELKKAHIPVFLLNVKRSECISEQERTNINNEITRIQNLYTATFQEQAPAVDLIGHSFGGDLSFSTSFSIDSTTIDDSQPEILRRDRFQIMEGKNPTANPLVGKVITIGMPSDAKEVAWAKAAGTAHQLYNVVAKYDAIVRDKVSALGDEFPQNVLEVNAGHLGILNTTTYKHIVKWLSQGEAS